MNFVQRFIIQNKKFCLFLAALTIIRIIYISIIPLTPQESYYWLYALYPDLSYFDHPPLVAYSIWLGTHLFGQNIFGIKIMAIVWSLLTNVFLYLTILIALENAEASEKQRLAFLTVLFYNLTIFSHLYAVVMVPDAPLLFFWLLIIFYLQKYLNNRQISNIYLMAIALGLALLCKYTAIAILPAIFLILIFDKKSKTLFLSPHPYLAVILCIIVFSPVIIWNMNHNWVSFQFQFENRADRLGSLQTKYFWQLLVSQMFILTPMPFVLFIMTTKRVIMNWFTYEKARIFFITAIFIIGGFIVLSFDTLIKMNWLLPGYLGLIITTVLVFKNDHIVQSRIFKLGTVFSILLIVAAYSILIIPNFPLGEGNTWSGWSETAKSISKLRDEMGGEDKLFIFSNSYKTASLLRYYLPGDETVYAQNIFNEPALQFDIWGIPESLKGKSALYIFTDRKEYKPQLEKVQRYFKEISLLKTYTIYFWETFKTRTIICYFAQDYYGPVEQKSSTLYGHSASLKQKDEKK